MSPARVDGQAYFDASAMTGSGTRFFTGGMAFR